MADAQALTADDYQWLYDHLRSSDAGERQQALDLSKKLTPGEQQSFFDFQKQQTAGAGERTRQDNSVLGVPPELAVTGALGIARAAAGEGMTLAQRAAAGVKAAAAQAAPVVKYEATKTILTKAGVPGPIATLAAAAVAGYKKGGNAAEGEAAEANVPPPKDMNAPHLDTSRPIRPSQLTEAQRAERYAYGRPMSGPQVKGSDLSAARKAAGRDALSASATAAEAPPAASPAVEASPVPSTPETAPPQSSGGSPPSAPAATPAALEKLKLSAEEYKEFARLLGRGMSGQQALEMVAKMRALAQSLGGATGREVKAAVSHRNQTGDW